jgi:hypothetical protein
VSNVTAEVLEAYLTEYGWTYHSAGENVWVTGFQGDTRLYPLLIRLSSTCVSFEIRPLLELDIDPRRAPQLVRELLELNQKLQLVKLALTEGGELMLACQLLAIGFDFETLTRALGILAYYADEIAPDLHARLEQAARLGGREPRLLS